MHSSFKMTKEIVKTNKDNAIRADLWRAADESAGFHERLQMRGNLRRRELIKPGLIPRSLEPPFLDGYIENKTHDAVKQCGNARHLGHRRRTSKRPDLRFPQDGIVVLQVLSVLSDAERRQCNSR